MGAFIARQPNGLLCRFSTVVDCITDYNMTEEEYIQSSHFRSQLLEAAVVEPYFTAEEWRTLVDNGTVTALYDEVNKILTSADDSALFQ